MKTLTSSINRKYNPRRFFVATFLVTWVSWSLSAYFSFRENSESLMVLFMLPGLVAPFAIAVWMIYSSQYKELRKSFISKLFDLRLIKMRSIPAILFIMPAAVVLSILVSILFGESISQLQLAEKFSFTAGFVPVLLVLFLAASFEELGWRSYAMDSLWEKHSYFKATMIFAVLWAFWHLPLFFIKDYYQYQLLQSNVWFGVNFMVSIVPMAVIISWLCRKNGGSILAAIAFHFIINLSQEAFEITQITKCIETFVLLLFATAIVLLNKEMFFDKVATEKHA